jgi:N utilization substance protein A
MKNEFTLAFNEVLEEKQLPREIVLQALEAAMVSAYQRAVNASKAQHVEAKIDSDTGKVVIFAEKEIVDVVVDDRTEVTLEDALKVDPNAQLGGMVVVESTPKDFGRVAAQTARQVIQQRIREAERDTQLNHYSKQTGDIVSGIIQAITPQGATLGLDMKAEGTLPRNQQIPGERFRVHDRIQSLLLEVKQTPRGPQIILSRAHRNFLRRLLENEVPEIYHGLVEIRSIAREPGQRSKVAVAALQPAVDPVGACVGIRGVRIQAIVHELNDEKIDVIEWNSDPSVYIAKSLSPSRVIGVYLNEHAKGAKTATVVVPEDQLSLAIGRDGQNARLAAKLTSWRIDIKSLPEAASDSLHKLQSDPEYAFMIQAEAEIVPQVEAVLAKKAEGRPVTPEEYTILSQFVDRVERGILRRMHVEKKAEEEAYKLARTQVPEDAFSMYLEDLPLSDRTIKLLSEAGYNTLGALMIQMKMDSDAILSLGGVGPKAMDEIKSVIASIRFAQPEPKPVQPEPEIVAEPVAVVAEPSEIILPEAADEIEAPEIPAEEPVIEMIAGGAPQPVAETSEEPILVGEEAIPVVVEEEEVSALDDYFKLRPEAFVPAGDEEEEEEGDASKGKKGKKKKRKNVEIEYDPDRDVVLVHRKRKRGDEWESNW